MGTKDTKRPKTMSVRMTRFKSAKVLWTLIGDSSARVPVVTAVITPEVVESVIESCHLLR